MALSYESLGVQEEYLLPLAESVRLAPEAKARHQQRLLVAASLVITDTLTLILSFVLVYFLRFKVFSFLYVPQVAVLQYYAGLMLWMIPIWLLIMANYRLYNLRVIHDSTSEYRRVATASTFALVGILALSFFLDDRLIVSRAWLIMVWLITIALLISSRFIFRQVLARLRAKGLAVSRALIVGANSEARQVAQHLTQGSNLPPIEVVGFVGERRNRPRLAGGGSEHPHLENLQHLRRPTQSDWPCKWLGHVEQVREVVAENQIDEVIITSTAVRSEELFEVVRRLTTSQVEIRLSPSLHEILTTGLEVQEINGLPLVTVNKVRITGLNALMKRTMDILIATSVLLVFMPVLLLVGLMVKLDSPGPILHRRRVVGQGGRVFDALKLRTMRVDGAAILAAHPDLQKELEETGKLKNDPRITKIGRFLRKTSLDELPQLINVLKGQMSLIGPRMITYQEMTKFGRWQSNLLTVKPGLTGLWQVSGRSNLTYDDRVRLDMHYIRNYNLWLDLRILLETIPAVLRGSGAY